MVKQRTIKEAIKTAEIITGVSQSEMFSILAIKDLKTYANKVKLFNFVLKRSGSSDYILFTLNYKHLIN